LVSVLFSLQFFTIYRQYRIYFPHSMQCTHIFLVIILSINIYLQTFCAISSSKLS